jgi:hypothetical protein
LRLLDIAGMDASNVALFDRVAALGLERTATEAATAAALALASTNQGIRDQIDTLTGAQTDRSLALRDATDSSTKALLEQLYAQQELKTATEAATAATAEQTNIRLGLERQLLELQDDTAALRLLDIAGMDNTNIALFDRIAALRLAKTAEEEGAAAIVTATDNAFAALERAVDAQRKLINTQLTAAQSLASEVGSIFDSLKGAVDDLYRSVNSTAQQSAAQARAFITSSLSGALATGSLPDSTALQDAISAARAGMDAQQFTSQFESDRARLVLAGELSQLKDIAGVQLTEAERQIKVLQDQLEALDKTLQTAREQINVMRGVDLSVISVADAIAKLADAMAMEKAAATVVGAAGVEGVGAITGAATSNAIPQPGDAGYAAYLSALLSAVVPAFAGSGISSGATASMYGVTQEEILKYASANGFPSFAVGTNRVPRDMVAQIHQGEMIVPKAFNPATSGIGNNTELVAELRELRKEFAEFKALQRAGNENTRQLADQFDNVTEGGNATRTVAV